MNLPLMYLDAGTGSLLVSAVVAGAAGVGVVLRVGWRRIVGFFSPRKRAEQSARDQEAAEQSSRGSHGLGEPSASAELRD